MANEGQWSARRGTPKMAGVMSVRQNFFRQNVFRQSVAWSRFLMEKTMFLLFLRYSIFPAGRKHDKKYKSKKQSSYTQSLIFLLQSGNIVLLSYIQNDGGARFSQEFNNFNIENGVEVDKIKLPVWCGQHIDLHKIFETVKNHGGFTEVN
jgi:hypothetical protein